MNLNVRFLLLQANTLRNLNSLHAKKNIKTMTFWLVNRLNPEESRGEISSASDLICCDKI